MNMSKMEISDVQILFPGAVTFRLENVPDHPEEWAGQLPDLTRDYLGETGLDLLPITGPGGARTSTRTLDEPTPAWANDNFPHKDVAATGALVGTVITGTVCVDSSGIVPGLEVLDTVALFDDVKERGIFEKYDVDPNDLSRYHTLLSYDSFFALTLKRAAARSNEKERAELLSKVKPAPQDGVYPDIVTMPLVETNPFSGAVGLCVEAERFIGIRHAETGALLPQGLVDELITVVETTTDPGTRHIVDYEQGKALLFSRDGTIHKALPGECRRIVHIGRIATNPGAHEMAMAAINAIY